MTQDEKLAQLKAELDQQRADLAQAGRELKATVGCNAERIALGLQVARLIKRLRKTGSYPEPNTIAVEYGASIKPALK